MQYVLFAKEILRTEQLIPGTNQFFHIGGDGDPDELRMNTTLTSNLEMRPGTLVQIGDTEYWHSAILRERPQLKLLNSTDSDDFLLDIHGYKISGHGTLVDLPPQDDPTSRFARGIALGGMVPVGHWEGEQEINGVLVKFSGSYGSNPGTPVGKWLIHYSLDGDAVDFRYNIPQDGSGAPIKQPIPPKRVHTFIAQDQKYLLAEIERAERYYRISGRLPMVHN